MLIRCWRSQRSRRFRRRRRDNPAETCHLPRGIVMEIDEAAKMSREAVGIFHSPEGLQGAIDELLSSGFHRAELSLLASEAAIMEKPGHLYTTVDVLADEIGRASWRERVCQYV